MTTDEDKPEITTELVQKIKMKLKHRAACRDEPLTWDDLHSCGYMLVTGYPISDEEFDALEDHWDGQG